MASQPSIISTPIPTIGDPATQTPSANATMMQNPTPTLAPIKVPTERGCPSKHLKKCKNCRGRATKKKCTKKCNFDTEKCPTCPKKHRKKCKKFCSGRKNKKTCKRDCKFPIKKECSKKNQDSN